MKIAIKLSVSFLMVALLWSCRGDQQNKLIGRWEQISFYDPETVTEDKIWEFTAGEVLNIYSVVDEVIVDSIQYNYDITGSEFQVVSIDETGYAPAARDPRGTYWVDELTKSNFKITKRKHPDGTTEAVYMRLELVKR